MFSSTPGGRTRLVGAGVPHQLLHHEGGVGCRGLERTRYASLVFHRRFVSGVGVSLTLQVAGMAALCLAMPPLRSAAVQRTNVTGVFQLGRLPSLPCAFVLTSDLSLTGKGECPGGRKILKKGGDKPLQTPYTTDGSAGLNPRCGPPHRFVCSVCDPVWRAPRSKLLPGQVATDGSFRCLLGKMSRRAALLAGLVEL